MVRAGSVRYDAHRLLAAREGAEMAIACIVGVALHDAADAILAVVDGDGRGGVRLAARILRSRNSGCISMVQTELL